MEIRPAAGNLKCVSVLAMMGPKRTHLLFDSLLRNVFAISLILDKVGPPRTSFWVIDATILELHTEIRINGEENCVQPPGNI
jgi:hypothetical protein